MQDNTSEKIEIVSMPCPVFDRGEMMVMQRGAGIYTGEIYKKEKACITFLKWLTEAKKNVICDQSWIYAGKTGGFRYLSSGDNREVK